MSCHGHQGNLFVNPYLGYIWWDQESDGEHMYPKKQKNPTDEDSAAAVRQNPELAAARGLWGNLEFLEKVSELNPKLKHTQFADYHRAGWVFRAIFKKDKKGVLLDAQDNPIRHRRSEQVAEGGPLEGHSPRERHAVRGLPFPAGCARRRLALRRGAQRHQHRVHRLPRHGLRPPDAHHHQHRRRS